MDQQPAPPAEDNNDNPSSSPFAKKVRRRGTSRRVRIAEFASRWLIRAGGFGTIAAVGLICGFLVYVAWPLFGSAEVESVSGATVTTTTAKRLATGTDEYRLVCWELFEDATLRLTRLDTGQLLSTQKLSDVAPTAWTIAPNGEECAAGFADGSVRTGAIRFRAAFLGRDQAPAALAQLGPGDVAVHEGAIAQATAKGVRVVRLAAKLGEPVKAAESAIRLIDRAETPSGNIFGVLAADGSLGVYRAIVKEDMFTGESVTTVRRVGLPYEKNRDLGDPKYLRLLGTGNSLLLIWQNGFAQRYDCRSAESATLAQSLQLVDEGLSITATRWLLGQATLLVGDTLGGLGAWFIAKPDDAATVDGAVLVRGHALFRAQVPVTALASSQRSRVAIAGYQDGSVRLFQVTAGVLVATVPPEGGAIAAVAISPKEDSFLALDGTRLRRWNLDLGHPEATFGSLFARSWYEGEPGPGHTWQSTGGTDEFEPKLGMQPLIRGTLKATLYSMLIALPIALCAAVYTSEFLARRWRAPVKSAIEMMASLPSVVLGFLAALVIAPFVQQVLVATLLALVTIPISFLLGARFWQLLPPQKALRWVGWQRLVVIGLGVPLGIFLARLGAPLVESFCFSGESFHGDIKRWLSTPDQGASWRGWAFFLLPPSLVIAGVAQTILLGNVVRSWSLRLSRRGTALLDLARYLVAILVGVLLAGLLGLLFGEFGDPRGTFVGSYSQLNAIIVGFVMGFAIVPIIYTLAEDALSSVPSALREGSLGAGATPWQTARRIVIPSAMSGIFGAIMVGLGRAVGETMIVLMAAGNTPLMDWDPFSGFRTLSANIAVELPEAVRNTTHYRTLFLAALVLFAMTFVLNTIAEIVRRRFRARFAEQM